MIGVKLFGSPAWMSHYILNDCGILDQKTALGYLLRPPRLAISEKAARVVPQNP